jgi:hypothetical protein
MLGNLLESIRNGIDFEELRKISVQIERCKEDIRGSSRALESGKGGRNTSEQVRGYNDDIRVALIEIEKLMKELKLKSYTFFGK